MSDKEELENVFEALKVILEDADTFEHVCKEVFKSIDADGSGSLEKSEIRAFIENICKEMGMKKQPDDDTINELFKELDEDDSDDITIDELKQFLKKLFLAQKHEVEVELGYKS